LPQKKGDAELVIGHVGRKGRLYRGTGRCMGTTKRKMETARGKRKTLENWKKKRGTVGSEFAVKTKGNYGIKDGKSGFGRVNGTKKKPRRGVT